MLSKDSFLHSLANLQTNYEPDLGSTSPSFRESSISSLWKSVLVRTQ